MWILKDDILDSRIGKQKNFQDGQQAGHGVRPIEKDVERRAIQIYFEEYSEEKGWSGDKKEQKLAEL